MPSLTRTTTASQLLQVPTVDEGLRAVAQAAPGLAAWLPDEERRRLGLPVDPAPPKRWRFRMESDGAYIADAIELPGGRTVLLMPNGGYVGFCTFNEVVSHLGTTVAKAPAGFRWSCFDAPPAPPAAPAPVEAEDWAHRVARAILGDNKHVVAGEAAAAILAEPIAKALRDVREWVPDRVVGELADARTGLAAQVLRLRMRGGRAVEVVVVFPATDVEMRPPLPSDTVFCCARCGATCASLTACETCGSGSTVFELPRWALDMTRRREAFDRDEAARIGARLATKTKETP